MLKARNSNNYHCHCHPYDHLRKDEDCIFLKHSELILLSNVNGLLTIDQFNISLITGMIFIPERQEKHAQVY